MQKLIIDNAKYSNDFEVKCKSDSESIKEIERSKDDEDSAIDSDRIAKSRTTIGSRNLKVESSMGSNSFSKGKTQASKNFDGPEYTDN